MRIKQRIGTIKHYFFPNHSIRTKVPISPRAYTSEHAPWVEQPQYKTAVLTLQAFGVAQTEADALRLLYKHPGVGIGQIIEKERPKRRMWSTLVWAWRRFKRIW